MTLGITPRQADLFRSTVGYCEPRVAPESIYGLLHRECYRLFPEEMFADGGVHEQLGFATIKTMHSPRWCWPGSSNRPASWTRSGCWTSVGVASPTQVTFQRCLKRVVERDYRQVLARACCQHANTDGPLGVVLYDVTVP